jgi:hypothetical protein
LIDFQLRSISLSNFIEEIFAEIHSGKFFALSESKKPILFSIDSLIRDTRSGWLRLGGH